MCGRYRLSRRGGEWSPRFDVVLEDEDSAKPRFNIAPTQSVWAVRQDAETNRRIAAQHHWGLIPFWAKDPKIGYKMINARSETVLEKPSFRNAFKHRRCLIPADGFYEWKRDGKSKRPFNFGMKDGSVFAFAGLWERWTHDGQAIESCCILTTTPNELMADIHDRMPVILCPKDYAAWLDPGSVKPDDLTDLLVPYASEEMTRYEVGTLVSNARNDVPECAEPLKARTAEADP